MMGSFRSGSTKTKIFITIKAISDIFFNKIVIWITYFFIFFFDDWNNRRHVPVDMRRPLDAYWILEVFWTEVSPLQTSLIRLVFNIPPDSSKLFPMSNFCREVVRIQTMFQSSPSQMLARILTTSVLFANVGLRFPCPKIHFLSWR